MAGLRRFILFSFVLALLFILQGQTAKDTTAAGFTLPKEFERYLDSLRKADDLLEWIYTWRASVDEENLGYLPHLEQAKKEVWRKFKNDSERLEWLYLLSGLGYYQMYVGNILGSIEAYEEAYRFYSADSIAGADVLEYVLKPLGNNYTRLGDYDRAFFIQEKGLATALGQNNNEQAASFYGNLSITTSSQGRLEKARQYVDEGLRIVKKDTSFYGFLLSTSADVLLQAGQLREAKIKVAEAITVLKMNLEKSGKNTPYWLYGAFLTQGEILKESGEFDQALRSFREGIKIIDKYFKGERKRELAKLLVGSGNALLELKQAQQAITEYNNAFSVLIQDYDPADSFALPATKDLYGENTFMDALNGKAKSLLLLNKKEEALQCFMLLFSAEKKLRYEFFSAAAKQQQQKQNRIWAESAMETAYQLWNETARKEFAEKVLVIAENSKSQLLLDEMMRNLQYNLIKTKDSLLEQQFQTAQAIAYYEREEILNGGRDPNAINFKKEQQYKLSLIRKDVQKKYPMLDKYLTVQEISADSLLKTPPENTTVIEFFTGEKGIYVIEVAKGAIQKIQKIDSAARVKQSIQDFVTAYFQNGPGKMMNDPQGYFTAANNIYQSLWPGKDIEEYDHCIIIPDGVVGYLPFDALITETKYSPDIDQWPLLIKKTSLSSVYSLQTLQQQKQTEHPHEGLAGFFISFDSSSNASIPAVKNELAELKKTVNGTFYPDETATLKEFQASLGKTDLLHISTHSSLQGEENIPALQLADDKFFLFELYGQAFQPRLVTLSACRTGYGLLAEGEGIISLAREFTAAGAGGIIAGLWNINDESTAGVMGNFYRQLVIMEQPAGALHKAKLQWLEKEHEQGYKKLPYFWAGLNYVGDNLPVKISSKKSIGKTTWFLAAFIIITGLIAVYNQKRKKRMAVDIMITKRTSQD